MRSGCVVILLASACAPSGTPAVRPAPPATSPDAVPDAADVPDPLAPCQGSLELAPEGSFLERREPVPGFLGACSVGVHAGAGAAGSTVRLGLPTWGGSAAASVTVRDLRGDLVLGPVGLDQGGAFSWVLPTTGEFFVELASSAPEDPAAYALELGCDAACQLPYTRYPLVFVHGAAGTDTYIGILDYWYGIAEPLAEAGYVFRMPKADAVDSAQDRAVQWAEVLDGLIAEGVGRRFNLIGHSQGGLDARYLISGLGYGDVVASLTTVSTPHRGTAPADLASGMLGTLPAGGVVLDAVVEVFIGLIGLEGDDLTAQLAGLSTGTMADFNLEVLDDPRVTYMSWAGVSCGWLDSACQAARSGETITLPLAPTFELLNLLEGPNDGLVSVYSARWGEFLGTLPADHMDEVGQIAQSENPAFDHAGFYLGEAARLASRGF